MVAHCNQCGLDWEPRVEEPACCPRCKRYDWEEPKKSAGVVRRRHGKAQVVPEVPQKAPPHSSGAADMPRVSEAETELGKIAGKPAGFPEDEEVVTPFCVSCEAPLVEGRGKLSGKFACEDQACSMYGKEQKGKR